MVLDDQTQPDQYRWYIQGLQQLEGYHQRQKGSVNKNYLYKLSFIKEKKHNLDYLNRINTQEYNYYVSKFTKWLKVSTEAQMHKYIDQLNKDQKIQQDKTLKKFIVCVAEYCVKKSIISKRKDKKFAILYATEMDFTYIDALSKLITILLRTIMNRNSADFLEKILDGIIIILTRNHSTL